MQANRILENELLAKDHYDVLYSSGYQAQCDNAKISKIKDMFNKVELPAKGVLLDFGCGCGVYTQCLSQLLPEWTIYGADISGNALSIAKNKQELKEVTFVNISELENFYEHFDCIFSHHVLEHVQDISATFLLFKKILKKNSWMLHICPCGNEGSFEYLLCLNHRNGIERQYGNRFFFEDPTHLRRLNSQELIDLATSIDHSLLYEQYFGQYYGALDWIGKGGWSTWKEMLSFKQVVRHPKICILFFVYYSNKINNFCTKYQKSFWRKAVQILLRPCYMLTKKFEKLFSKKLEQEWQAGCYNKAGSELFMWFSAKKL